MYLFIYQVILCALFGMVFFVTLSEVVGDFQRSRVSKGHELSHLGCVYIYIY